MTALCLALALTASDVSVRRTISVYGYKGDQSGPAHGMICAVPYKRQGQRVVMEFSRGSYLRLSYRGKSAVARVADVCNGRYWARRIDLAPDVWKALGGKAPGLMRGATVSEVKE